MPDLRPFEEDSTDLLRLILDTGRIGIWELDLRSGEAVRNRYHDRIFGYSAKLATWTYDIFLDHVVAEDRARVDALQRAAIAETREWLFECRIVRHDGEERWISVAGRPIVSAEGEAIKLIGHVMDITDTKVREERLSLLTEELNHRVKNMLAMIRSIVHLSARNASDIPSFAKAIDGRVSALARTQDLFASDAGSNLPPSELLARELEAFADYRGRVTVSVHGEQALRSSLGQSVALVFHELITNAIKYGAFANAWGRVEVSITGGADTLDIVWTEEGGPLVTPPLKRGFGSRLMAGLVGSKGSLEMDFRPEGLRCTIAVRGI